MKRIEKEIKKRIEMDGDRVNIKLNRKVFSE